MNKIAVLGSGVMGSGIAAQIANSGHRVILLDIAGKDDKNSIVKKSFEKLKKTRPSPITSEKSLSLIEIGNFDDDFDKLKDCDWIIEVVIENLEIKQDLYAKIDKIRKKTAIISSNTSTLPISKLLENSSTCFKENFLITHFFNPPRYMELLELVTHSENSLEAVGLISHFIEKNLGKIVVNCKDSPGFIANRIGCFWLENAKNLAAEENADINLFDEAACKIFGFPKTGIFGLWDLIGIDLMPLIAKSLIANLPENDAFCQNYDKDSLIDFFLENQWLGRKSGSGFYRMQKLENGKKNLQAIDLSGKKYVDVKPSEQKSAAKLDDLNKIVTMEEKLALKSTIDMLRYVLEIAEEIADNIYSIDEAMKAGYNWKFGPFEMIDIIGVEKFKEILQDFALNCPKLLKNQEKSFYLDGKYLNFKGIYEDLPKKEHYLKLETIKQKGPAALENSSFALWQIENGIHILELKTKMNILNEEIFNGILEISKNQQVKALVIADDDDHFCAGADLNKFHKSLVNQDFSAIKEFIDLGQKAMMALKNAKFPVISAVKGFALGGGAELMMHSTAICAHIESKAGLVERKIGLIPGWGGTKEMVLRNGNLENVITSKISSSAHEMQEMNLLHESDKIVMNRHMLLFEAIKIAQNLMKNPLKQKHWQTPKNQNQHEDELNEILQFANLSEEKLLAKEKEFFMKFAKKDGVASKIAKLI